jgi:N-acetylglutamate synthase-like GNAT family acetyltransferase
LGTGTLHIIQKSNRQMGLIEDVVVAPNQREKGIGKKIIYELVQLAEKIGCYKTILNSSELNQLFYEKQGFSKEQVQMTIRH